MCCCISLHQISMNINVVRLYSAIYIASELLLVTIYAVLFPRKNKVIIDTAIYLDTILYSDIQLSALIGEQMKKFKKDSMKIGIKQLNFSCLIHFGIHQFFTRKIRKVCAFKDG